MIAVVFLLLDLLSLERSGVNSRFLLAVFLTLPSLSLFAAPQCAPEIRKRSKTAHQQKSVLSFVLHLF
jgi:hypothetical protein